MRPIFVTGGAGFIGSCFVLQWLAEGNGPVIVFDKLTYAGNRENLAAVESRPEFCFVQGDIVDGANARKLLDKYRLRAIVHFAAESHVDRSILGPAEFIRANIEGTFQLLEAARGYWNGLEGEAKQEFRFLHVSTDEVYGSLSLADPAFTETTPYAPNSPYSASKAASDHLVRAYHHTYGLPTLTTNGSNNYGPRQFPEKLIPLMILNALGGRPLPVYGDGMNVRDWLYVGDHCGGIATVLGRGNVGETYSIGGRQEMTNLDVVREVCSILDELVPAQRSYKELITFVKDRPGHDRRYAMNIDKIELELGWRPRETFRSGIYNLTNTGETSWYGFAGELLTRANASLGTPLPELAPIPTSRFPRPARRPMNSRLNCDKLGATFGVRLPAWQDALALICERLADARNLRKENTK